ncbi:MAG: YciI family protein [Acidobacteriota bacterium]
MKYMLLMTGTKADFDWYAQWPKEALAAYGAFMHSFNQELRTSGKLVAAEGLTFPQEAKIVRAGKKGEPVTDGVFPEAKEFLAGFWIVEVASAEEAYQLAARVSSAPGNKERGNQPIEVRQVMSGPPA